MEVRVRRLKGTCVLPSRAYTGDAGFDLYSCEPFRIEPGCCVAVGTGISVELPNGTEGQIRPRSGLALKHGITVLNAPGTIDEGYRGEITVILINHGRRPFVGKPGIRVAQLVVQRRLSVEFVEVDVITDTDRGPCGFGSSGD